MFLRCGPFVLGPQSCSPFSLTPTIRSEAIGLTTTATGVRHWLQLRLSGPSKKQFLQQLLKQLISQTAVHRRA